MVPSQTSYQTWQQRLQTKKNYRYWWQFWSNYSFVFFFLAGAILLSSESIKPIIILGVVSFIVARLGITPLINLVYKKQRPYQKYNLKLITSRFFSWRDSHHNSFPSRHSITYASVAGSILVFNPVLGTGLLIVTAITGVARVILGYHWPTDILAGLVIGTMIGFLLTNIGLAWF